jgi:beta-lactamase regulating signal transducer with metallopeptidase domain
MGSEPLAGFAAAVYTLALLATVPAVVAAVLAAALRGARAEARVLVWRSAVMVIAVLVAARALPVPTIAWSVPALLAAPLVALGRVQVTAPSAFGSFGTAPLAAADGLFALRVLLAIYLAGVGVALLPTAMAALRVHRVRRHSATAGDEWLELLREARSTLGVRRSVALRRSALVRVPITWGCVHPSIVLPPFADAWSPAQRRMVLLHELQHVRADDWVVGLLARVCCALFWFHPGVWWIARGLREDCELACDDRVIAAGAKRSDYAEILMTAAGEAWTAAPAGTLALSRRRGLRARLYAILDTGHDVSPLERGWRAAAVAGTLCLAMPVSVAQLAPTRDVLTTLLRDSRWESRAYAVIGLAQRPDTVAVARATAEHDPNPRVRAWARYALSERGTPLDAPTAGRELPAGQSSRF